MRLGMTLDFVVGIAWDMDFGLALDFGLDMDFGLALDVTLTVRTGGVTEPTCDTFGSEATMGAAAICV